MQNAEFLALVFAILVQAGAGIWWAANITSRLRTMESNHSGIDRDQRATDDAVRKMEITMALLNQSFAQVTSGMEKIDKRLEGIERHLSEEAKT